MRIQAHDLLAVGQAVCVGNRLGTVIKAEIQQAVPCGLIAVHTIEFTHRMAWKRTGMKQLVLEAIKPVKQSVNYAFIEVIESIGKD